MTMRMIVAAMSAFLLASCSLSSLTGGGEVPEQLVTLSPTTPEPAANLTRSEAVTFAVPLVAEALATNRVAAIRGGTAVAYIQDLWLVDQSANLFQQLVSETTYRSTNLLVVDPRQAGAVPALRVTGTLYRFGFDVDRQEVVVGYEALWERDGVVSTRRFEAREPAIGYAADVTPALNTAANRVAIEVANWIAG